MGVHWAFSGVRLMADVSLEAGDNGLQHGLMAGNSLHTHGWGYARVIGG